MKIAIASDHGGFDLKKEIVRHLIEAEITVTDFGTDSAENSVDYPEMAKKVALAVLNNECDRGITICGSGIGISIAANKFKGIRAALCHDAYTARMSRAHNDANILAIGGRTTGVEVAFDIVDTWLKTPFDGGRHQRRIDLIAGIEKEQRAEL